MLYRRQKISALISEKGFKSKETLKGLILRIFIEFRNSENQGPVLSIEFKNLLPVGVSHAFVQFAYIEGKELSLQYRHPFNFPLPFDLIAFCFLSFFIYENYLVALEYHDLPSEED